MAEMRSFIGKHGLKLLLTISVTFLLVFMILPILDMFTKSVVITDLPGVISKNFFRRVYMQRYC